MSALISDLAPAGISEAVAHLDKEQAAWAHAGARVLMAQGFQIRVASNQDTTADWYLGEMLCFRPALNKRAPLGANAERLMQVLSEHESLLAEIETATGLAAEFSDHGAPAQNWAIVQISKAGEELGELAFLASPPNAAKAAPPMPLPLACAAARLPLADAEKLTGGDMVILETGPWPLIDPTGHATAPPFALDPATGRLGSVLSSSSSEMESKPMATPDDMPNTMDGLSVPVCLNLPDVLISLVELAKLAEGGTLDIGMISEGLQVSLSVGGRSVGKGELVRLGDRFAVLLDAPTEAGSTQSFADASSSAQDGDLSQTDAMPMDAD